MEEKSIAFKGSGWYIHFAVNTYWDAIIFFALPAIILLIAFVGYFRLLLKAWRSRKPT
jgi:hypothetical protein